jgi:hypothetical protein
MTCYRFANNGVCGRWNENLLPLPLSTAPLPPPPPPRLVVVGGDWIDPGNNLLLLLLFIDDIEEFDCCPVTFLSNAKPVFVLQWRNTEKFKRVSLNPKLTIIGSRMIRRRRR